MSDANPTDNQERPEQSSAKSDEKVDEVEQLDLMLKRAWQAFIRYDTAALQLKKTHVRLRATILILSFLASLLAVAVGSLGLPNIQSFQNMTALVLSTSPLLLLVPTGLLLYKRLKNIPNTDADTQNLGRVRKFLVKIYGNNQLLDLQIVLLMVAVVIVLWQPILSIFGFILRFFLDTISIPIFAIIIGLLPLFYAFLRWFRLRTFTSEDNRGSQYAISTEVVGIAFMGLVLVQISAIAIATYQSPPVTNDTLVETLRLVLFALPLLSTGILLMRHGLSLANSGYNIALSQSQSAGRHIFTDLKQKHMQRRIIVLNCCINVLIHWKKKVAYRKTMRKNSHRKILFPSTYLSPTHLLIMCQMMSYCKNSPKYATSNSRGRH